MFINHKKCFPMHKMFINHGKKCFNPKTPIRSLFCLSIGWQRISLKLKTCLCRLFNLAVDPLQPEQEYYLQPAGPGRSRNASSMCPVGFSFGGDHLWDRFSVSFMDILSNSNFGLLGHFPLQNTCLYNLLVCLWPIICYTFSFPGFGQRDCYVATLA